MASFLNGKRDGALIFYLGSKLQILKILFEGRRGINLSILIILRCSSRRYQCFCGFW